MLPSSALTFARVAATLLRLSVRVDRKAVDAAAVRGTTLFQAFIRALEERFPKSPIDELSDVAEDFLAQAPAYENWLECALVTCGAAVRIHAAQPFVEESLTAWREVTAELDADALIALAFAREYDVAPTPDDLHDWGVFAVANRFRVLSAMEKRLINVYDLHTHLEGCETAPIVWRFVIEGRLRPRNLKDYSQAALNAASPGSLEQAQLTLERRAIAAALDGWWWLCDRFPLRDIDRDPRLAEVLPSDSSAFLWRERIRLIRAFQALREWNAPDADKRAVRVNLDAYLAGKQHFLRRFTHHTGHHPGLTHFRRFFDRTRDALRPVNPRGPINMQRQMVRWHRMTRFALESPRLSGIEFRISPFDDIAQYVRFFQVWREKRQLARPFRQRNSDPEKQQKITFVVHFTRDWPDRFVPNSRLGGRGTVVMSPDRLRHRLDRESSVLHEFRWRRKDLADPIVGVDVANLERHGDVEHFAPYLLLLRYGAGAFEEPLRQADQWKSHVTDDEPLRQFAHRTSDFTAWWRDALERCKVDTSVARLRRLGLTYHCGEDFHHPIQGLMSVSLVHTQCRMRTGDRIGHGLALGLPLKQGTVDHSAITRGALLDLFVWLRRRAQALPATDTRTIRDFDDEISRLSEQVFGRTYSAEQLYDVLLLRHMPPSEHTRDELRRIRRDEVADIYDASAFDPRVRDRRSEFVPPSPVLSLPYAVDAADAVRAQLCRRLQDDGIVLEVNPTSNMAIAALGKMGEHPVFRILRYANEIKFTVNCDDPGTFATRLENEYALVDEAIEDLPEEQKTSLRQALDRAVETSEHARFGKGF